MSSPDQLGPYSLDLAAVHNTPDSSRHDARNQLDGVVRHVFLGEAHHVVMSCHVVITEVFFLAVLDGVVVFAKESHRAEEEEKRSKSSAHPDSRLLTNSSSLVTAIESAQGQ